jgi:hypothetical protein
MKHGRLSRAILEWEEVLARVPGDAEAERASAMAPAAAWRSLSSSLRPG